MANKKISELAVSGALVGTEIVPIVKSSATVRTTLATIMAFFNSAVATLTNKTLTSPVINTPTGIVKGDVGLGNVDNTSDATKNAAAVTLANKTLTAPIISTISNTGTITLPTSTDTLVGKATTDTLTNKTLTAPVMTTPTLGVATATTINKVTITAPTTSATLTLVQGSSLVTAGAFSNTLTTTATTNVTLPTTGTLATLTGTETLSNKTLTTPDIGAATGTSLSTTGNHVVSVAGGGLRVKEGSNAKQGTAVLVAGSVVVSNTSVTATSRIFLTSNVDGGTPGWLRVSARTAATSFTITSSSGTDTSTVAYQIFEPA